MTAGDPQLDRERLIAALGRQYGAPIEDDAYGDVQLSWPCPICDNDPRTTLRVLPLGFGSHYAECSGCSRTDAAFLHVLGDRTITFLTPAELRRQTPTTPAWVWDGYLARGWLTILGGKPKAGKSSTVRALVAAIASRAPAFLERQIQGGPVIMVAEESAVTALAGLPDSDEIKLLTRDQAWPKPGITELVTAAVAEAKQSGAVLLVIDSFAFWTDLPPDAEKDAGATQAALSPLLQAASSGLAVLLVHHQRKAAGEGGDALRGSGAIVANADVLIELERLGEDAPAHHRQLVTVGRWPETPGLLVIDHDPRTGGWQVVGHGDSREDAGRLAWQQPILAALPTDEPGLTYDELQIMLNADKRKWGATVDELRRDGRVERSGAGRKGDPYRFWKPTPTTPRFRPVNGGTEKDGIAPGGEVQIPSIPLREDGIKTTNQQRPRLHAVPGRDRKDGNHALADLTDQELLAAFPGSTVEALA